jgi:hypothetical protein
VPGSIGSGRPLPGSTSGGVFLFVIPGSLYRLHCACR